MAVVTPSSRSLAMSSNQPPRTPPRAGQSSREDGQEMLTDSACNKYPQASDKSVDNDFAKNHLRQPVGYNISSKVLEKVKEIQEAGTVESSMYKPAAEGLTLLSKAVYGILTAQQKSNLRQRHRVPDDAAGHLTFVDHHSTAPTHFPQEALCPVKDAPDLVGVYNVENFTATNGVYKGIPHHRIEAIVEAKSESRGGGRAQAASYAYRHQQARPDHPMFYCLVIKPQWYQVILSSPAGIVASPETPWDDLTLLAAYVYSHYFPPRGHFTFDESITWSAGSTPDSNAPPLWNIKLGGKLYTDGTFLFVGDPWGRRTTVFLIKDRDGKYVVLKETYFDGRRRWKEENILTHIHRDGDVPGVVRLRGAEHVATDNKTIEFGSSEGSTLRTKKRLVFCDRGERLLTAQSVNEVLEAIYDALEVHRLLLNQRRVLHRDMSMFNLLIHPTWGETGQEVFSGTPPFIRDVLAGKARPLKERFPTSLTIDVDNAALLEQAACDDAIADELAYRTGTPMYVARSVSAGEVLTMKSCLNGERMPSLTGEAYDLYIAVHGEERYNKYQEKDDHSQHGGYPPLTATELKKGPIPPFSHRAEHDAESIFWTMLIVLLRIKPESAPSEKYATGALLNIWDVLYSHGIPDEANSHSEKRSYVFNQLNLPAWKQIFFTEMKDVAELLDTMCTHILPEYALWKGEMEQDHLHEAMQRLILQYLVNHRDQPIPVDPSDLRPTVSASTAKALGLIGSFGSQAVFDRVQVQNVHPSGSRGGSTSRGTGANLPSMPIVVSGSKRQSQSRGGQGSKRRKGASGGAVKSREAESEEE